MSTVKQEKLADEIIANSKRKGKPRNKKELLVSAGYSEITASADPGKIIEQEGVQEALINKGFSVDGAKDVVQRIMYGEKVESRDKLRAADMVFKVHGAYVPENAPPTANTYNIFFNPQVREAATAFEQRMKELLAGNKPTEA